MIPPRLRCAKTDKNKKGRRQPGGPSWAISCLFAAILLLLGANDGVDGGDDFQRALRGAGGDDRRAVRHQRLVPVLLPPAADVDVLADLADNQLSRRGAAFGAELHDEEVAVFDAFVEQLVVAGAENDLAFLDERGGKRSGVAFGLDARFALPGPGHAP